WMLTGHARSVIQTGTAPDFESFLKAEGYIVGTAVVLFGLAPILIVRRVFGERASDYGLRRGNVSDGLRGFLTLSPLFIGVADWSSRMPEYRATYPINPLAASQASWLALHVAL